MPYICSRVLLVFEQSYLDLYDHDSTKLTAISLSIAPKVQPATLKLRPPTHNYSSDSTTTCSAVPLSIDDAQNIELVPPLLGAHRKQHEYTLHYSSLCFSSFPRIHYRFRALYTTSSATALHREDKLSRFCPQQPPSLSRQVRSLSRRSLCIILGRTSAYGTTRLSKSPLLQR
ncbi:hypothetical protein K504DRAFT_115126 [Pleomassaria siparia CBS 279.74]|uniref:Uncharacterized protein n=1 Tax=Pleomassaria siparia CBS 279.74 TaxID=1314801 RepID=A0A6G1JUW8_9PLEO|nr:hypothetical protein K504DRAFT_115126 [Pleomassaria siparia CBS 279.74]